MSLFRIVELRQEPGVKGIDENLNDGAWRPEVEYLVDTCRGEELPQARRMPSIRTERNWRLAADRSPAAASSARHARAAPTSPEVTAYSKSRSTLPGGRRRATVLSGRRSRRCAKLSRRVRTVSCGGVASVEPAGQLAGTPTQKEFGPYSSSTAASTGSDGFERHQPVRHLDERGTQECLREFSGATPGGGVPAQEVPAKRPGLPLHARECPRQERDDGALFDQREEWLEPLPALRRRILEPSPN